MNTFMKSLLLLSGGVAIGAVAGILTAPKSGRETREDLREELDRLKSKLDDLTGQSRNSMEKKIEDLKKALSEMEAQMSN